MHKHCLDAGNIWPACAIIFHSWPPEICDFKMHLLHYDKNSQRSLVLLKYEKVQEQSCTTIFPRCFRAAFCTYLLRVLLFGFLKTKENWTQNLTSQQVSSEASLPLLGRNVSEHSAPFEEQQLDRAKPKEDQME